MVQFVELGNTRELRLLGLFLRNPTTEFSTNNAIKATRLAKATTIRWLNFLKKNNLLLRKTIGRTKLYSLNRQDYFAKQLKKFYNATSPIILDLMSELKGKVSKVVLFGSWARGEDRTESDIDIFIVSERPESELKKIAAQLSTKHKKKLALTVKTVEQYLRMAKIEELLWRKVHLEGVLLHGD